MIDTTQLHEVIALLDKQIDSAWADYTAADEQEDSLNRAYYLGIARGLEQARSDCRKTAYKVSWHEQ